MFKDLITYFCDKTCVICNIVMSVTGMSLTAFGIIHVFVHILVKQLMHCILQAIF